VRLYYILGTSYIAVAVIALVRAPTLPFLGDSGPWTPVARGEWFDRVRPHCNALEVETALRREPPPRGMAGAGLGAACWALAGRIDAARAQLATLDGDDRWRAAGIVFEVGHPVADMGDDRSAGPIMELVVEFWPNHYMALYHAGAARYALGESSAARKHLTAFLQYYDRDDGWTRNARHMLRDLEGK
jgi:hypothetical protein